MPKYTKNQDSNVPWMIDESAHIWTLGKNATISVANEAAINIAAGNDDNTIQLKGDLDASGAGSEGLRMAGSGTMVRIARSSHIEAEDGIYNMAADNLIKNAGMIDGKDRGIASDSAIEVVNTGRISADAAVTLLGDSSVTNLKGGLIEGDAVGVRISTFGDARIENYGKIVADGLAVHVNSAGTCYLMNEGKIVGDVRSGSGDDVINNVEGRIVGQVSGGLGDDDYYVGRNKVDLVEHADGGHDRVFSYSSLKLGANLEDLLLIGDKSVNAKGNDLGNTLRGNSGDNVLRGRGGTDFIEGFTGDDLLHGGAGTDYFIFRTSYDRDTVADFDLGNDYLVLAGLVDDFAELAPLISQHGDDTWISFGGGDRLILKGIDADDLTEDSVLYSIPT